MNRHDAIESFMRRAQDMTDGQIREMLGKLIDLAWREGYRQCAEDRAEGAETMLAAASMLEKPQYMIVQGAKFLIPMGEPIKAAIAALRHCAVARPHGGGAS